MLVMRFYDRRVVVCLLEKNLLWEEGKRKRSVSGQRLSPGGVSCLNGVREATNRGPVRVFMSINEFLDSGAAIGDRDSQT
jgi:hypothetical protein